MSKSSYSVFGDEAMKIGFVLAFFAMVIAWVLLKILVRRTYFLSEPRGSVLGTVSRAFSIC